jgi:hypothetical protein
VHFLVQVNAFRERRALALTLDNTKAVVNKFNRMLSGLASNIVVFIWLIVLKIATIKIVILLVSQIVLFAFVFGNTLKITFEAIIFLFFMHPYDVGDRCEIDQIEVMFISLGVYGFCLFAMQTCLILSSSPHFIFAY